MSLGNPSLGPGIRLLIGKVPLGDSTPLSPKQTSLALFSFCLACLLVTTLAENAICQGECMVLSNCNEEGPLIRFPFKLKDQPDHCGYPGFVLSCTEKKQTLLDLPCSVKL
ncbi:hypothetical protein CK203_044615 [Vitis vinifera]|uniref:RING-type E3 ubiquitin transferase n=1 Tax=Vitis vinifera TaxID=29760 RepID=A0A438HJN4_VITVI|nr:hypothetical protein CK203_044615 [Vitis vinifera]